MTAMDLHNKKVQRERERERERERGREIQVARGTKIDFMRERKRDSHE